VVSPYVFVGPGTTVKLPFGIESVASEILDGDGKWESGIEYQPPVCGPASVYRSSCFGYDPDDSGESLAPLEPKEFVEGVPTEFSKAFAIYSGIQCTPVGNFWATAEARGREFLLNGRERALENEMAFGAAHAGPYLTDATTVDITPVAGTAIDVVLGMALLEQWIGENSAGQGVILGARRDVLLAASGHALMEIRRGDTQLNTRLGTPVAALSGFDGSVGPNGDAAGVGESWLFALGSAPRIWRGSIINPPRRESLDRGFNDLYILHEQATTYAWNCGAAAVLVTSEVSGAGSDDSYDGA
jgi:hypothetical protein